MAIAQTPAAAELTRLQIVQPAPGSVLGKRLGGMSGKARVLAVDWRKVLVAPTPPPAAGPTTSVAQPAKPAEFAPVKGREAAAPPAAIPVTQYLFVRPLPVFRKMLADEGQVAIWEHCGGAARRNRHSHEVDRAVRRRPRLVAADFAVMEFCSRSRIHAHAALEANHLIYKLL